MSTYTTLNLKTDIEDPAPKHGMGDILETHFAREPLGMTRGGLSHYTVKPEQRLPFGHTHAEQEEVYVVVAGSARMKVEDDLVDLGPWDAIRVAAGAWRGFEAGPDGAEILAFGAPDTNNGDVEMQMGWWAT